MSRRTRKNRGRKNQFNRKKRTSKKRTSNKRTSNKRTYKKRKSKIQGGWAASLGDLRSPREEDFALSREHSHRTSLRLDLQQQRITPVESMRNARAEKFFKALDKDRNGYLTTDEIGDGFVKDGVNVTGDTLRKLMELGDLNDDDKLGIEEFRNLLSVLETNAEPSTQIKKSKKSKKTKKTKDKNADPAAEAATQKRRSDRLARKAAAFELAMQDQLRSMAHDELESVRAEISGGRKSDCWKEGKEWKHGMGYDNKGNLVALGMSKDAALAAAKNCNDMDGCIWGVKSTDDGVLLDETRCMKNKSAVPYDDLMYQPNFLTGEKVIRYTVDVLADHGIIPLN